MIPNYYEFQNSAKLLSGERALEHIPYELEIRGCKRPMLLSDRVLERFGTVQTVVDAVHESGLAFAAAFLDIPADLVFRNRYLINIFFLKYNMIL